MVRDVGKVGRPHAIHRCDARDAFMKDPTCEFSSSHMPTLSEDLYIAIKNCPGGHPTPEFNLVDIDVRQSVRAF